MAHYNLLFSKFRDHWYETQVPSAHIRSYIEGYRNNNIAHPPLLASEITLYQTTLDRQSILHFSNSKFYLSTWGTFLWIAYLFGEMLQIEMKFQALLISTLICDSNRKISISAIFCAHPKKMYIYNF